MKDVTLKWYGKEVSKDTEKVLMNGLKITGESALRFAEPEVPVETGTLQRSGTVTTGGLPDGEEVYSTAKGGSKTSPATVGTKLEVNVSYNTPYGLILHESQTLGRKNPWRGRKKPEAQWKWLERGMNKAWAKVNSYMKRAARRWGKK